MDRRILDIFKRALKNKIKITVSVCVVYLLTGSIGYSKLVNDGNIIDGLKLKDKDFENNGRVEVGPTLKAEDNTVDIKVINANIVNNGTIFAKTTKVSSIEGVLSEGNGIAMYMLYGDSFPIDNIINKGLVIADSNLNEKESDLDACLISHSNGIGLIDDSISNIKNEGIILGKSISFFQYYAPFYNVGNGISLLKLNGAGINNIINKGNVIGDSVNEIINWGEVQSSGNGITYDLDGNYNLQKEKLEIKNEGILSGNLVASGDNNRGNFESSGNGISIHNDDADYISGKDKYDFQILGSLNNLGTISGYVYNKNNMRVSFSGNGIYTNGQIGEIKNNGVIKGTDTAVSAKTILQTIENNGILAGNTIYGGEIEKVKDSFANKGLYIELKKNTSNNIETDGNEKAVIEKIEIGNGGEVVLEDGSKKNVVNGSKNGDKSISSAIYSENTDIYLYSSKIENNSDLIINGVGTNKGALVIDKETDIKNSIVNGYNTGIYLENGNKFTATDVVINGGGLKNDIAVLRGDDKGNTANILGNSIINGKVEFGTGNDNLTIANSVQVNGDINGGEGKDILNLGEKISLKNNNNPNILHNISGFEEINTNGNITLFETVKITGANAINIKNGDLVLRVDPLEKDNNGKIIGHALYENSGKVSSDGGNLIVGLNGLGENGIISMGATTIDKNVDDSWWKESDHLKTNSLVLDAKVENDGKDIKITVKESIPLEPSKPIVKPTPIIPPGQPGGPIIKPTPKPPILKESPLYKKLNKIYASIVNSGEIGKLENTTLLDNKSYNESLGGLLTILNQIYANTPYVYTLKSSRDSIKQFGNNLSYLTIKPKKGEYIVQGKAIYTGTKNDTEDSGKNYYGFDLGTNNYKTTTTLVGGIATLESGITNKSSFGIALGGNNQNTNFKGNSEIKGNSLYLGIFGKTEIENFKLIGGVGYQYTSIDAERSIRNRYDAFRRNEKYDINSFNVFVEGKYSYILNKDIKIEPKIKLSYYDIKQEEIDEGYDRKNISMKVGRKNVQTGDIEVGVDIIKEKQMKKGKVKGILSLGMIKTVGEKEKGLEGEIIGEKRSGSRFEMKGAKLANTIGKIGIDLEYEKNNGLIYTAGGEMEFAKKYNRDISVKVGIGYKF